MSSTNFNIKPSIIYVYFRVSTKAQTYKSNGLDEQNQICSDYLKKNYPKYEVEYYNDIGSSYNDKNILTNLNKIIRKMYTNSLLLVRDISRLGRNTFQVFNLLKKIKKTDSHIISIEENLCYNFTRLMDRKFSHHVIDSEEKSDDKSIKSKNRYNLIKKSGGYTGIVPPYGTQIIKSNKIPYIYKNSNEINTLKLIKDIYLKYLDITKTTNYLNKNNHKDRKNILWTDNRISNILKKYFPNITLDNNSNLIDDILSKYPEFELSLENIKI
jgi:DNA invertase Pin-like site-specific DNA recombinase